MYIHSLTWFVGPIQTVVFGVLRHQPVVALPGFTRAEFDVDPIVLILNPLHRHRPFFAARARAYQYTKTDTRGRPYTQLGEIKKIAGITPDDIYTYIMHV